MKVLVFGHSNSDGSMLPNREDAWPWLLQRMLAERGLEAEVIHKRLFAGAASASMVRKGVEDERPDVVILCTSTFGVVVRLVSNRVRERWGKHAGALALRGENYVARHFLGKRTIAARAVRPARRLARKLIGVETAHSTTGLVQYYRDCFSVLAQHEDIATIVFGGVGYGPAVTRLNPGWEPAQASVYLALKEAALHHRFEWQVLEDLMGGPTAKLKFFHPDGVHTNEASHLVAAETLLPLVVARL